MEYPRIAQPAQVLAGDLHIKPHIVSHQHPVPGKFQEPFQGGKRLLPPLGQKLVGKTVDPLGIPHRAAGTQKCLKPLGHLAIRPQAHRRQLDNLVGIDIGAGGLYVKHHHPALFQRLEQGGEEIPCPVESGIDEVAEGGPASRPPTGEHPVDGGRADPLRQPIEHPFQMFLIPGVVEHPQAGHQVPHLRPPEKAGFIRQHEPHRTLPLQAQLLEQVAQLGTGPVGAGDYRHPGVVLGGQLGDGAADPSDLLLHGGKLPELYPLPQRDLGSLSLAKRPAQKPLGQG